MYSLTIVIPCYNEETTLNDCLDKVLEIANELLKLEIIIVDDHSKDGTTEILKNLNHEEKINVYFHENNLGKGAAIQTALKHITGDITIIQDADLEYSPNDYEKIIEPF